MPDVDVQGVSDYHGAFVSLAAAQSISHNTVTAITFTAVGYDPLGLVNLGAFPTRITFKENGLYLLSCGGEWVAGIKERQIGIHLGGGSVVQNRNLAAVGVTDQCLQGISFKALSGQYIEMFVYQFSGADLNISACWMKVQRVDRIAVGT
jgi:hypothetical protein